MKERIQEALRRRHRKGDEGFTLIELLVVILIIAILAAVGIVALLSALNSGKKSSAKTTARQAQTAITSTQTGLGVTDYQGVTAAAVFASEPNLVSSTLAGLTSVSANEVLIVETSNTIRDLITRSSSSGNHVCYTIRLTSDAATQYGSASVAANANCPGAGDAAYGLTTQQATGWND